MEVSQRVPRTRAEKAAARAAVASTDESPSPDPPPRVVRPRTASAKAATAKARARARATPAAKRAPRPVETPTLPPGVPNESYKLVRFKQYVLEYYGGSGAGHYRLVEYRGPARQAGLLWFHAVGMDPPLRSYHRARIGRVDPR